MKALSVLRSAIDQSSLIILVALIAMPLVFPEVVAAATLSRNESESALVFKIKDSSVLEPQTQTQPQTQLTYEEITHADPLVIALEDYLDKHGSPLKVYAKDIVKLPRWQLALSVSWVESNFGKRCADNNCSGIGVEPGHRSWRKYPDKLAWFTDMSKLMQKPFYAEKHTTCKQMNGKYNVPGSRNWVNGCEQKYNQLMKLTETSEQQRVALANAPHSYMTIAVSELEKK